MLFDAKEIERPADAGREPELGERDSGPANLFTNGSCVADARDHRLEPRRQMPHEVQYHFFRAPDRERVRQEEEAGALHTWRQTFKFVEKTWRQTFRFVEKTW